MDDTDRIGSSTAPPASHFPPHGHRWWSRRPTVTRNRPPAPSGSLCAIYHEPIRHWLARKPAQVRERDDAVQGFVEHLLQQNRFRNFQWAGQVSVLPHQMPQVVPAGEHRKGEAEKRGAGAEPVNLGDVEVGQPAETDQPLDRELALAVHRRVMARLAAERYAAEEPKATRLQALRPSLFGDTANVSQAEIGHPPGDDRGRREQGGL